MNEASATSIIISIYIDSSSSDNMMVMVIIDEKGGRYGTNNT